MNSISHFENLKGRRLFFVESNELKSDMSRYVHQVASPELLTVFPIVPRVRKIAKYDGGIIHLTPRTIHNMPGISVDRIIDTKKENLPLIVLVSLIGDPDNKIMDRLHHNGFEAHPNNDTASFISAMSLLDLMIGAQR